MNFRPFPVLWLELAVVFALAGALCVSRYQNPLRAWRLGILFSAITLVFSIVSCAGFYIQPDYGANTSWSLQQWFVNRPFLAIDEISAPLLPMVALVHFLTALATGRTKMRRFSLSWSLASEAISLATFSCITPWVLIGFLAIGTVPGYIELLNRGKPTRVYLLHMALFVALLVTGLALIDPRGGFQSQSTWAVLLLLLAVLIRSGTVPVHCWLTEWFEHASFGNALLLVTPLAGVYAAVRLVLPIAPHWVLQTLGMVSLITALYASSMAIVQREARRFFAYFFLSHASLVLVGLELHTSISLTGAMALWMSVTPSLAGLGLTLRALEARFGRLSLVTFHGLYEHSPALAVCFALMGLASVGFPGTLGFIATELLVEGAIQANVYVGFAVALVAAMNGVAVVRVYFYLFTGARHASTVSLAINPRERFAVLTLTALILGGGLFPQPGIASRYRAATGILRHRAQALSSVANEKVKRTSLSKDH